MNSMSITCKDRERILKEGTSEDWRGLELHAQSCQECERELAGCKNLSSAAQELHQEWNSPQLWPNIAKALREQKSDEVSLIRKWWKAWHITSVSWQTAAACCGIPSGTQGKQSPRKKG